MGDVADAHTRFRDKFTDAMAPEPVETLVLSNDHVVMVIGAPESVRVIARVELSKDPADKRLWLFARPHRPGKPPSPRGRWAQRWHLEPPKTGPAAVAGMLRQTLSRLGR